jgi:heme-degrading monooxygenase HmoA
MDSIVAFLEGDRGTGGETGLITVGMHYDVRVGKETAFEDGFKGIARALEGSWKGHKSTRLYRDVEKPRSYLIFSEWESMEDFQTFMHSDAFAQATTWGREEILEGRPKHTILKHS